MVCGLVNRFLPTLPKVSPRGSTKTAGLYWNGPKPVPGGALGIPELGSPITSGYDVDPKVPLATPALSTELTTLNGEPLW